MYPTSRASSPFGFDIAASIDASALRRSSHSACHPAPEQNPRCATGPQRKIGNECGSAHCPCAPMRGASAPSRCCWNRSRPAPSAGSRRCSSRPSATSSASSASRSSTATSPGPSASPTATSARHRSSVSRWRAASTSTSPSASPAGGATEAVSGERQSREQRAECRPIHGRGGLDPLLSHRIANKRSPRRRPNLDQAPSSTRQSSP